MADAETACQSIAGKPILSPRICIIALSAIADDPRVRRQGDAFAHAGWKVVGVGIPGARSAAPNWTVLSDVQAAVGLDEARVSPAELTAAGSANIPTIPVVTPDTARPNGAQIQRVESQWRVLRSFDRTFPRLAPLRRKAFGRLVYGLRLILIRIRPRVAETLFWSMAPSIRALYELGCAVDADVWLANDWTALPIAARLAGEKGGICGYDTHEFAAEEYAEKWKWRFWRKPFVCAVESRFISGAAAVSAVSGGIAERLDAMYGLKRPSLVIRNTPNYECCSFRPTGPQIHVLYHGIVAVGRGLEAAIDSVALWRPEFDLTIRGPENPGFSDMLRQRIRDAGLDGRVRLVPPVPMTELVREAAAFDIGFFALPGHSRHNEFALPNKFFEYLMAGLALCVSDLPEMARLVDQYRLGVLIPGLDPAAIAASVNGLDRGRIDAAKRNALAAAEELCWERESARLVEAYRALLPQAQAAE